MMQAFLAALGVSQIIIGKIVLCVCKFLIEQPGLATAKNVSGIAETMKSVRKCNVQEGAKRGYLVTFLGASLLGIGMAMAGACPGTLYSQLGSGYVSFQNQIDPSYAQCPWIADCLGWGNCRGVYIFIYRTTPQEIRLCCLQAKNIDYWRRCNSFFFYCQLFTEYLQLHTTFPKAALTFGTLMVITSFLLGHFAPNSIPPVKEGSNFFATSSWSPQVTGLVIGMLQFISMIVREEVLGMSSSLVALLSPFAWPLVKLRILNEECELARVFPHSLPKIIYTLCAVGGAAASATYGSTFNAVPGIVSGAPDLPYASRVANPHVQAFLGGVFLWLGARIAGGCTSGHGISGFAMLRKTSILAVPAMFGAGIGAMFILKKLL